MRETDGCGMIEWNLPPGSRQCCRFPPERFAGTQCCGAVVSVVAADLPRAACCSSCFTSLLFVNVCVVFACLVEHAWLVHLNPAQTCMTVSWTETWVLKGRVAVNVHGVICPRMLISSSPCSCIQTSVWLSISFCVCLCESMSVCNERWPWLLSGCSITQLLFYLPIKMVVIFLPDLIC